MILGMNVLVFVLTCWVAATFLAWMFDYGPEIYREQEAAYRRAHPKTRYESELTIEMAVGSFDPDETMKLHKVRKEDLELLFVMKKTPEKPIRRRHAKM